MKTLAFLRKVNLFAVVLALMANSSCTEHENKFQAEADFQFRLLTMDGVAANTFKEGENFVFSFLIINKSNNSYYLNPSSINTTDIFRVYKKNAISEDGSIIVDMGKPYEGMFCVYAGGISIAANDTLKLEIPWKPNSSWEPGSPYFSSNFCMVNSDNVLLSKGQYQTQFRSSFEFSRDGETYQVPEKIFNIDFVIN